MLRTSLLALTVGSLAACSIGAPPGFSSGNAWSIPLVGALEDGVLVVPVMIQGTGPYLFAIDPDAPISSVDEGIASELKLYSGLGPRLLDESDTYRPTKMAEVLSITLGNLTVQQRNFLVQKVGFLGVAGRQMRGVIGRDIIADSLAFGFDRDTGLAYLATQQGFTPPAEATAIQYRLFSDRLSTQVPMPGRRVVTTAVGGRNYDLHLDLGATQSQLRAKFWGDAGLAEVPAPITMVDEVGTSRTVDRSGLASNVDLAGVQLPSVKFAAYDDRRWDEQDIDGTLGLDFFRGFAVWANWDSSTYYLTARGEMTASAGARIGRWNDFASCAAPGCATARVYDPFAEANPGLPAAISAPGGVAVGPIAARRSLVVTVTRDAAFAGRDLEVVLALVDANGQRLADRPLLIANLPASANEVSQPIDADLQGATAVVVDASPFPRRCTSGTGCVFQLAAH